MAEINVVVEQYMNHFNELQEYVKRRFDEVPQRKENFQNQVVTFLQSIRDWVNIQRIAGQIFVYDFSPVGSHNNLYRTLMELYLWVSLCLMVSSVAYPMGSGLLFNMLKFILDVPTSFVLSLVLLPCTAFQYLRKTDITGEDERRAIVLFSTEVICILLGFVLKSSRLPFYPPPAFVAPFVVGLSTAFSTDDKENQDRQTYFLISVGPVLAFYALFGYFSGSLCLAFVLWSLVYCCLIVVDFQMKLGRLWTNGACIASEQIVTIYVFTVASFVMSLLFSN